MGQTVLALAEEAIFYVFWSISMSDEWISRARGILKDSHHSKAVYLKPFVTKLLILNSNLEPYNCMKIIGIW